MPIKRPDLTFALCGVVVALLLCACSSDESGSAGNERKHQHENMKMATGSAVSGHSLFQLESEWTDQHGTTVRLSDYAGSVTVLAMVYTHCDFACPRIIGDMRQIRKQLDEQRDQLSLVIASINPERDTVAHLAEFGRTTGLTEQGWTLMRAPEATVRELAAVLGVRYRRVSEQDFAHSNLITVLAPDGTIAHRQVGLGVSPEATVAAIKALLADAAH